MHTHSKPTPKNDEDETTLLYYQESELIPMNRVYVLFHSPPVFGMLSCLSKLDQCGNI